MSLETAVSGVASSPCCSSADVQDVWRSLGQEPVCHGSPATYVGSPSIFSHLSEAVREGVSVETVMEFFEVLIML